MTQKNPDFSQKLRLLSVILYAFSIFLGMLLAGASVWADLEAGFYGFDSIGGKRLATLKCPLLITRRDQGVIAAALTNPLEKPITPTVRIDLSSPGLLQSERSKPLIEPGKTEQFAWTVTSANVDLGFFILVKVYFYPVSMLPGREASCGMMWLDLPVFSGNQLVIGILVLGLVCMGAGLTLWLAYNRPLLGRTLDLTRVMIFLELIVLASLIFGLTGWWGIGGILLVLAVLMIAGMGYFLLSA